MNPPSDLPAWRKARRAELLSAREALPLAERRERNASITRLLHAGFGALAGHPIGFCWPYKAEPDPRFFVRTMRDLGSRTALPVVVEKRKPLEFRDWWPGAPSTAGVFDLPIPQGTEVIRPVALLVPPIGIDAQGYRLGYGGGFFDITLASLSPQPLKIAIAFEVARIPTIYPQPHDVPMDFVVTETGVEHVVNGGLVNLEDAQAVASRVAALLEERA